MFWVPCRTQNDCLTAGRLKRRCPAVSLSTSYAKDRPQKHFHSILRLKKHLKSILSPFWASKSTSKVFWFDFEPQKALQKHLDSILRLKNHLKSIWTRFWASKSIAKTFWDLLFSSGRVGAYCIRPTNDPGRDRKLFDINNSGLYRVRMKRHIGLSLHIGLSVCPLCGHLWGVCNTPLHGYIYI